MATNVARESSFCDENQNINIVRALHEQKQTSTFCDVIMKVCGRDIYAHSNILAAASPYFNTFLSQDLPRQFSQRAPQIIEIQIDGSEPNMLYEEAVATVIDFIYTGMLTISESNVAQVSEIARIMQIESVVRHCEDFVAGKLDGENMGVLVKRKGGIDATTNTERGLLVDLMTSRQGGRPGAGDYRSKPPHGKFLSLVSVSTQVVPKLLGLRESEKEMVDKAMCTENRDESESILQKSTDPRLRLLYTDAHFEKPRARGRKRGQAKMTRERTTQKSDVTCHEGGESNVSNDVDNATNDLEPHEQESTCRIEKGSALQNIDEEEEDSGKAKHSPSQRMTVDLKKVKIEKDETKSNVATPRRSSRPAKPKVFDSDFEEIDLTFRRQRGKKGLFRAQEKGTEKPSVMYAEKEAPIMVSKKGANERTSEEEEIEQSCSSQKGRALNIKEETGHSLIELAAAAAAEVEREKERETEMTQDKGKDGAAETDVPDRMDEDTILGAPVAEERLGSDIHELVEEEDEIDISLMSREDNEETEENASPEIEVTKAPVKRLRRRRIKLEREYKHRPGGKFQCDICHDFGTNSVKEFGSHLKRHKIEQNVCYYCDRQFEGRKELTEHMEEHKGPVPFLCVHCNARFKVRTQLNIHLPKHSSEKPFICETCSMGFKWKHALKAHMITHSNRKDHLCDICGYATAHKNQMTAHKRIHTGQTIKCHYPNCTFQATKMQNLKYHYMTHTREKPHQCEVCGQAFSLKKNMKRHMLMHNAEIKKTRCAECEFSSPRLDKVKEHMLKQHGIGTPPEKRLKVSDLVAQNMSQLCKPQELVPQIIQQVEEPHEEASDALEMAAPDQKTVERFIIEIENEEAAGGTQQVHIAPNQTILVTPNGMEHELATQTLGEIAIAVPPGLEGTAVMTEAEEIGTQQAEALETIVTTAADGADVEQYSNVQYAEVMIASEQVPGFVQQVTFVPQ